MKVAMYCFGVAPTNVILKCQLGENFLLSFLSFELCQEGAHHSKKNVRHIKFLLSIFCTLLWETQTFMMGTKVVAKLSVGLSQSEA